MPEKGDEGNPGKGPEKENKDHPAGCQENKPHLCASGHCCGRQSDRRLLVSQYFGEN